MKHRVAKLEYHLPKFRKSRDLSALSIPELKELEVILTKKEERGELTAGEVERINEIMAKVK